MDPPRRPNLPLGRSKSYAGSPSPRAAQRTVLDDITNFVYLHQAALASRPRQLAPRRDENNPSIQMQRTASAPITITTSESSPSVNQSQRSPIDPPSSPTPTSTPTLAIPRAPPMRRGRSFRDTLPSASQNIGLGIRMTEREIGMVDRRRERRYSPLHADHRCRDPDSSHSSSNSDNDPPSSSD